MRRTTSALAFALFSVSIVACAGAKPQVAEPAKPAPKEAPTLTAASVTTPTPAPAVAAVSEDEINAFLAPKSGETSADTASFIPPPNPDEDKVAQKCAKAEKAALARTAKAGAIQQIRAIISAKNKADKRCFVQESAVSARASAAREDSLAQAQIGVLASALAHAPKSCEKGAPNPNPRYGRPPLMAEPLLLDRLGWSCLAEQLSEKDKEHFTNKGSTYVYSFNVDERLGTYEIVGRGRHTFLDASFSISSTDTELVLRGRLGKDPQAKYLYRRTPAPKDD